jgi:hypothetical protein
MGLGRPGDNERYCEHCGVCHPTPTHIYPTPPPTSAELEKDLRQRVEQAVRAALGR